MQHVTQRAFTLPPCGTVSRLDVGIPLSGLSFSAFFARAVRCRRSGFLAFASGIVRAVVSVIVVQQRRMVLRTFTFDEQNLQDV